MSASSFNWNFFRQETTLQYISFISLLKSFTHFIKFLLRPNLTRRWYKKFQEMKSKAFSKSINNKSPFFIFPFSMIYFYLFGVLRRFQHCTGHITTGSWKGRGNQYIEFARVVYCKLPTNGKQLPAFPLKAVTGIEPRPQRWEARVLPLCHRGPPFSMKHYIIY